MLSVPLFYLLNNNQICMKRTNTCIFNVFENLAFFGNQFKECELTRSITEQLIFNIKRTGNQYMYILTMSALPSVAEYWILKPVFVTEPSESKYTNTLFPLVMISSGRLLPQSEDINGAALLFPS